MTLQRGFLGLLTLLVLTILVQSWRLSRIQEARLLAESQVAALRDTTVTLTRTARQHTAMYVSEREVLAGVADDLRRQLKAEHARVESVVRVQVVARPESTGTARPATARVDTVQRYDVIVAEQTVSFHERVGRYQVEGWTRTPPPEVWLKVQQDPIRLTVLATQVQDRWSFVADSNDSTLVIGEITGKVVLRRPGLWQRYKWWVGVIVGGVSVAVVR